jgi:hypothetical protein
LARPAGPDLNQDAITGRVYKVGSLANGEVSIVFHVESTDADMALGLLHLRGTTVKLSLEIA